MELTEEMIYGLNNMNVYAQRARLGDLIAGIIESGGGSGTGDTSLVIKPSYLNFPNIGSSQNLYIDTTENTVYRWDSSLKKYYMVGSGLDNIYKNVDIIYGGNANG